MDRRRIHTVTPRKETKETDEELHPGGLAAFAIVAVPAAVGVGIAPANADTTKCSTDYNIFGKGSNTICNSYGDDGSWNITSTYCDNNGNCTTG